VTVGSTGAARRYARALLDVALQRNEGEQVRGELRDVREVLGAHPDLDTVLSHPAVAPEKKKKIIEGLWRGKTSDLVLRLLVILAERGRVPLLPRIEEVYKSLWNAHRNVVAAEAISASPLDGPQQKALATALRQATGMEVELASRIDPAVLGGVKVIMGGRVYDGTVRAQLEAMRQRLVRGAV
jgi:F-type H+-transporting ATPase subunit delta